MKLNIAFPATGCQKLIDIEDEKKLRPFYDKRMSAEVSGDPLGDEWKGYILRITGGNDKQGFPMKQGVLTNGRVRLLLSKGHSCYRPRREGERRRKSVRGCIVDGQLSVLSMIIVKKGEQEIPGLTDKTIPRRLGPKRASKIRRLFNLSKEDDVRMYVIKRPLPAREGKKPQTKCPKIQRLVTPRVLQRKRHLAAMKTKRHLKMRQAKAEYCQLLAARIKEVKERRRRRLSSIARSRSESKSQSESKDLPSKTKVDAKKGAKQDAGKPRKDAKLSAKKDAKLTAKKDAVKGKKEGGKPAKKDASKSATKKPAGKKDATKSADKKPAAKKDSAKPKTDSAKPKTDSAKKDAKPKKAKPSK